MELSIERGFVAHPWTYLNRSKSIWREAIRWKEGSLCSHYVAWQESGFRYFDEMSEINPEYSLQELMLKLKFWPPDEKNWLIGKDPDAGIDQGQKEKRVNGMVGWHHWLNGHTLEQTQGDSEGQESLTCYSLWGRKELDTTQWLNSNNMVIEQEVTALSWLAGVPGLVCQTRGSQHRGKWGMWTEMEWRSVKESQFHLLEQRIAQGDVP